MSDIEIATLKARVEFLEQLTEGIMNEPGTGHIQGTNSYEKFCQVMSELNYDEKWITELKAENKELKKENEKNKQTFEIFKKKLCNHIYKDIVEKLEDIPDYLPPGKIPDVLDDITNNWEDNYDEFVEEFIK